MRTVISLIFLFTFYLAGAQSILLKKGMCDGDKFSYAVRSNESISNKMILGFLDSASTEWNAVTWCSMMDQIVQDSNAILLVPELSASNAQIQCLVQDYLDSVSTKRVQFISLGSGGEHALGLDVSGYSGLFISPKLIPRTLDISNVSAFAVCRTEQTNTVGFLVDSLSRDSHWVKVWDEPSANNFYIDNYKTKYHECMTWIDSVQLTLFDSSKSAQASELSMHISDVMRQGKPILVDLHLMKQGMISYSINDLSSKAVSTEEYFLGRGEHTITIETSSLEWGVYTLVIEYDGQIEKYKFMVRG